MACGSDTLQFETSVFRPNASIRCAVAWVSLAALGLGYWWVLFDRQRRSWPDIVSRTETVVLPKK